MLNYSATKDKRIIIFNLFLLSISLLSLIGIGFGDVSLSDKLLLGLAYASFLVINMVGLSRIKKNKNTIMLYCMLVSYLWLAYFSKLVLTINNPDFLWVSNKFFSSNEVLNTIIPSFYTVFPGLLGLILGFLFFHNSRVPFNKIGAKYKINHGMFFTLIVFLLILRLFNQIVLNIGIPGVIPNNIGIPFLTGILELLTRPVLLVVVNLYFFSVLRLRDKRGILFSTVFMLINISIGLRVGYKSELVMQGLLIIYYIFENKEYLSIKRKRIVYTICFVFTISTVFLYPLVNHYRQYLLSGNDIVASIEKAKSRHDKYQTRKKESALTNIYNRFNGIGAYYLATRLGENQSFSFESFLTGETMDLITKALYGANSEKAVTAFGTTQFAVLYLVGGGGLVVIGGFIIGWGMRAASAFMEHRVFKLSFTFDSFLPLYCFLCIKFLNSGGAILLYFKELCLVIAVLYIVEKKCYKLQYGRI